MKENPSLTPVREAHRFDEAALAHFLARRLGLDTQSMSVRQFEGGQSNPTFLLTLPDRQLVLRKKPPGKLLRSAHMVEREYQVMTALRESQVPVPPTLLLHEDESLLGTPFFVMEFVAGRVVADPRLPGFSAAERSAIYDHAMTVLAALHRVDLAAAGLTEFGKPGNYYQRQISRWTRQYQASQTEEIAAMERLMSWLPEHVPASDETTLVHGDFRLGNCILHPTEPRIIAVLDWELSTLGHPLADLAYFAMGYHRMPGGAPTLPGETGNGVPGEQALIQRYAEASGFDPGRHWTFYMVFQLFRLAAIIQGVVKRGMDGNASSARWQELRAECQAHAECAVKLID